jgi:predicted nucleic acid-binding protein
VRADPLLGGGEIHTGTMRTQRQYCSALMTKFVVDSSVVLQLASTEAKVSSKHKLLAPTLLRSQVLSALYEAVHRGKLPAEAAREQLMRVRQMRIRLLGDAVLQRRAWQLAEQLGWDATYDAEYVALTQLQADAFVTLDKKLARSVKGIVTTASIDELL